MRKTTTFSFTDNGRPLSCSMREMSAFQMESWLARAAELLPAQDSPGVGGTAPGLAPNALDVADAILRRGIWALACADYARAAPLLQELLDCCAILDGETGAALPCTEENINRHISAVTTLIALRQAALHINLDFAQPEGRSQLHFRKESAFRREVADRVYARTVNVPEVAAALISQSMASLHDLQNTYSFADALDLLEIANVRNYNHWAASEKRNHR